MAEDKKSPSPTPAMHRPTKSMARSEAAAAKIEPKQKIALDCSTQSGGAGTREPVGQGSSRKR